MAIWQQWEPTVFAKRVLWATYVRPPPNQSKDLTGTNHAKPIRQLETDISGLSRIGIKSLYPLPISYWPILLKFWTIGRVSFILGTRRCLKGFSSSLTYLYELLIILDISNKRKNNTAIASDPSDATIKACLDRTWMRQECSFILRMSRMSVVSRGHFTENIGYRPQGLDLSVHPRWTFKCTCQYNSYLSQIPGFGYITRLVIIPVLVFSLTMTFHFFWNSSWAGNLG